MLVLLRRYSRKRGNFLIMIANFGINTALWDRLLNEKSLSLLLKRCLPSFENQCVILFPDCSLSVKHFLRNLPFFQHVQGFNPVVGLNIASYTFVVFFLIHSSTTIFASDLPIASNLLQSSSIETEFAQSVSRASVGPFLDWKYKIFSTVYPISQARSL